MTAGSSFFSGVSMRGRMTVLIAAAMLPLCGFVGVSLFAKYEATLSQARREVLDSASLAAARQSQIFATSRILLDTVRRTAGVSVEGGTQCQNILGRIKDANPQLLSLGVANAEGIITCHDRLRVRQSFSNQMLVRRILAPETSEFVVGDFMIGKVTRKPTIPVAMAIRDEGGRKVGAVFASLDLERLASAGQSVSFGGRRSILLVQPGSGRVLTHFPKANFDPGTPFAQHPLIAAMRAAPVGGVAETPGFEGVRRIFGFSPIEGAETAGIMLAVGESRDFFVAPIRSQAIWWVGTSLGAFLLAIAAAWWLGDLLQLRPIGRLSETATRIGAGDYDTRTHLDPWQSPELRDLGRTLDRMAARLAAGREAERAVAASEARFRLLAENTADLIASIDRDGRRTFVSPASRDIYGWEPHELMSNRSLDVVCPEDRAIHERMIETLRSGVPVSGVQHRAVHRDGHRVWVEVSGRPAEDGQIVFAIRDITERRKIESDLAEANRQLVELASTDALTGLLNRRSFDEALGEAFEFCAADGCDLSLLMIDVDRFKTYNDRYGHTAGDDCLRQVADALRSMLRRPGISVARYGGEEFAIVLPETTLSAAIQEAEALRLAMRRMAVRHEASEYGIVTVSIGIATLSGGRGMAEPVELVRAADGALYAAKAGGRDRIEIGFASLAKAS